MSETGFQQSRPVTITVASVVFAVFGFLEIVAGIAVAVVVGLIASAGGREASQIISGILGGVAAVILIVGLIDLAVGYGLWKMQRWAAILGMLLSFFGIIIESFTRVIFPSYYYGFGDFYDASVSPYTYFISSISSASQWVYILIFILIAISWKAFERQTIQETRQAHSF